MQTVARSVTVTKPNGLEIGPDRPCAPDLRGGETMPHYWRICEVEGAPWDPLLSSSV
jgi:hypothetical protein